MPTYMIRRNGIPASHSIRPWQQLETDLLKALNAGWDSGFEQPSNFQPKYNLIASEQEVQAAIVLPGLSIEAIGGQGGVVPRVERCHLPSGPPCSDRGHLPSNPPGASATRPVVLVLLGAYWPGNEATGPNQSFNGLANALGCEFDFHVIARDRPFGAAAAVGPSGHWLKVDTARCRYCEAKPWGAIGLSQAIRSTPHDVLILNGFFDREFTIPALIMRRLGLIPRRPTILSPRGEFSAGSQTLDFKLTRKAAATP